jgi:carbamoyltransferase
MNILGIHCGHDASLALVRDGKLISSISVERYSRNKKDTFLSSEALDRFLFDNQMSLDDIDTITMGFWNKSYCDWLEIYSPKDNTYPFSQMGTYNKESIIMNHLPDSEYDNKVRSTEYGYTLPWYIDRIQPPYANTVLTAGYEIPLNCVIKGYDRVIPGYFVDHHAAHAAAAFYSSPFKQAAIMTVDASMNDPENCSGYYVGDGESLSNFREPGLMIGTFYDAATELLGLGPGTTKAGVLMGLAAFGKVSGHVKENAEEWIKPLWDRNSPIQDNQYIDWLFSQITGKFPHIGDLKSEIANQDKDAHFYQRNYQTVYNKGDYNKQEVMDHAAAIQYLCERAMVKYAQDLYEETKEFNGGNLCLAGGVALNCNANFKIKTETGFDNIHFFPACGDDGISAGSAMHAAHKILNYPRVQYKSNEICYLGTNYTHQPDIPTELQSVIKGYDIDLTVIANKLAEGEILCWYQGRSELGPRALGNRSFVTNPAIKEMKDTLNAKVKMREWFRPFAPVVLEERKEEWFDMDFESPYMLYTVPCKRPQDIPSAVHIDNSARVQTITPEHNYNFWRLILEFEKVTGIPVVMNTSLNIKGEPIVETPEDALKLFIESEVTMLVINGVMYFKELQS